jgi:acylphosphatase
MSQQASLKATVHGRVQGVFFRAFVESRALLLNLTGYVRNCPNGNVEVVAEGEKPILETFAGYLKIGPPAASVDKVILKWAEPTGAFKNFQIRS